MFDDLIPPSPTSLDESTQQRSLRISSSRRKILRKHQQKQNSLNDDIDVIPGSQVPIRSYTPHPDTDTPIAKRAKLVSDSEQNPRKLIYDSDELTQRHSPFSSTAGSPVFFDLDDDPEPVESQKSTTADSYATARDPSFVFGGEIPPGAFLGFRTAANKPIHLPPQQNHLDIFKESPEDKAMDEFDPFPVDSQLSDHVLDKVANRFTQVQRQATPPSLPPPLNPPLPPFMGFTSAAGRKLSEPTEEDLRRAKQWERELEADFAKDVKLFTEVDQSDQNDFCASLERLHEREKQRLDRSHSQMSSTPKSKHASLPPTYTQEVSAAVHAVIQDSEFFLSQLPVSPIVNPAVLERKRRRQTMVNDPRRRMLLSKVTNRMRSAREELLKSLAVSGGSEKPADQRRPFKSEFIEKKLGREKVSLRDAFWPLVQGHDSTVSDSTSLPSFSDLLHFQFNAMEFLPNDTLLQCFTTGIPVAHFLVPMNSDLRVGASELEAAFLSAKGIDPPLISSEWFKNALKLVLWKVISMDLLLPDEARGDLLTLENVLNELHYRYYLEIDLSKRSVLRECLEKDAAPGKLMVLLVADIQNGDQVLLSDGHYSVRASIDECLERQIERGKLRRGVKLMVDSAEFVNLHEGHAPLEVPASVSLRIHGNSTRRCKWDVRLGRFNARRRLLVSLRGLDPKGGAVSAVDVRVIRKYPLLFVTENRHRNDRMHRRYRRELESRHYNLFERLYHRVEQQLTEEEKEEEERNARQLPEFQSLAEVDDVEDLWNVMNSKQQSRFSEEQLTSDQRRRLGEYREERMRARRDRIKAQVDQIMEKDLSSPTALLRIKVTDLKSPAANHCAELWIWNVAEEVERGIKEGATIRIGHFSAIGMRNNLLHLKAGRRFIARELKEKEGMLGMTEDVQRRLTRISEMSDCSTFSPPFLEFDVVVIVLRVAVLVDKFQSVFATDDQGNLLCLNFFQGLGDYACEGLVRPGQVVALSNVQWRRVNLFNVPNGYVNELTGMTMNPRDQETSEVMEQYKRYVEERSVEEILEEVTRRHPFLVAVQSDSKSSSSSSSSVPSPTVLRTPLRPSTRALVTPGKSAILETPLMERQISRLAKSPGGGGATSPVAFQSPRTPVRIGVWNKRKLSLRK